MLKAEMLAVAASSGAALPYFMTRICIGGTLAKDAMPKRKAAARNGHLNGATKPATIRDTIIAKSRLDVEADLKAGALVELLREFSAGGTGLQIVYPATQVQPRRVRLLIERIAEAFSSLGP
jgi:hypothetical protein